MKKTLVDAFEQAVADYAANPFLWEKTKDEFEPATFAEVRDQVYDLGAGFAIKQGSYGRWAVLVIQRQD